MGKFPPELPDVAKVPDEATLKFLHRVEELLRLEHNKKGEDFRSGRISKKEWEDYREISFKPRLKKVLASVNELKEKLDLVRDYSVDGLEVSPNLEKAQQLKAEGILWKEVDKDIDLTKI